MKRNGHFERANSRSLEGIAEWLKRGRQNSINSIEINGRPVGTRYTVFSQIASVYAALQPHWQFQPLRFLTLELACWYEPRFRRPLLLRALTHVTTPPIQRPGPCGPRLISTTRSLVQTKPARLYGREVRGRSGRQPIVEVCRVPERKSCR